MNPVDEIITGCEDAAEFLRALNACTASDDLADRLALAAGLTSPTPRLSGFARRLQKHLERLPREVQS